MCSPCPILSPANLSALLAAAPPAFRLIRASPGMNLLCEREASLLAADGFISGCVTGTAFGAGGSMLPPDKTLIMVRGNNYRATVTGAITT